MRCRKVIKDKDHYNIVWFGSYGKNEDGTSKKYNDGKESYAKEQEGLASSLIQRLNCLQGELFYKIDYGLPLLDKIKDREIFDSIIVDIILSHPDVRAIKSFYSEVDNQGNYKIKQLKILSHFDEEISLFDV